MILMLLKKNTKKLRRNYIRRYYTMGLFTIDTTTYLENPEYLKYLDEIKSIYTVRQKNLLILAERDDTADNCDVIKRLEELDQKIIDLTRAVASEPWFKSYLCGLFF